MAYPEKMRERALKAVHEGHTKTEVSKMLGLGINTLKAWEKLELETGSLKNRELNRKAFKINRKKLLAYYNENPYSTNREAAKAFNCSISGICGAKKVLGITRKKTLSNIQNVMKKKGKNLYSK